MKQTNKNHIRLRFAIIIAMMVALSAFAAVRLHKTAILNATTWNLKSDSIYTRQTNLPPERGKILTDSGTVLAATLFYYTARIDWKQVQPKKGKEVNDTLLKYLPALADSLSAFEADLFKSKNITNAVPRSPKQWSDELLAQAKKHENRSYRLFPSLTHNEFKRLKSFPFLKKGRGSGFYYESLPKRVKPYGLMASRSVGTVNNDPQSGMHGRTGLESALDSLLYGTPGVKERVQLTSSVVEWESTPAIPGYDITTTINVHIQDIVENELLAVAKEHNAKWASCILMEVATGEIKAISNIEWNDSLQTYIEGSNNAVKGVEPGSIVKPISMMVALENGTVTDINKRMSTSAIDFGSRVLSDEHGRSGGLTPLQIIETSNNPGISRITLEAYKDKPDGFRQKLQEMGFFEPLHTGISGEEVPKFKVLGNKVYDRSDLANMSFGYTTHIPPMHTLAMYNAIANNGKFVRPHLVKKLSRDGEPDSIIPASAFEGKQVCTPENAQKLRMMLHEVVWGNGGTARGYFAGTKIGYVRDDDVEIAGKTGTANIYNPKTKCYDKGRNRVSFCGFFPYKNPKYSCIVVMNEPNCGAPASCGFVLKSVARKLWAFGLLDNKRSIDKIKNSLHDVATLFATLSASRNKSFNRDLGIGSCREYTRPGATAPGTVPNVVGMGLREAVRRLEDEGVNVSFSGTGFVSSQSPGAGAAITHGSRVALKLSRG